MAYHDRRAAALVAVLAFVACTPSVPAPQGVRAPPRQTLVEIQGTRLVFTDSRGRLRWEVEAAELAVDRTGRVSVLAPRGRLVERGGVQAEVRADRALYVRGSGRVELTGRVRVRAAVDRWLSAGRVSYEPELHRLVASGGVRVRLREWTVWAQRVEMDPGLRRARFEGSVRVRKEAVR